MHICKSKIQFHIIYGLNVIQINCVQAIVVVL
jgi:hypothetical protein